MKTQLPIVYSQQDSRWGKTMLGFNTQLPYNMENYGCLVTCLSMVCRYYGKDIDPGTLNQKLKDIKGFANSGDYVYGSVPKIYTDIKETRYITPSLLTDAQINEIKASLDAGYPVIIGLDYNPKDVDYDSHFVVIVDYDASDENNFTIADPLGGKVHSLKDYLGWFKPSARGTIERYIITSGPKPKLNSESIPVLKTDFANLVHGSENWDKTVEYTKPGADPKATRFEDVQTVIAGIKSRQTDLENQLKMAISERDNARTEVKNQEDKLANILNECQTNEKLKEVESIALKKSLSEQEKVVGEYRGTIESLQGQLRDVQKQVGLRDLQITALQSEVNTHKKGIDSASSIWVIIKRVLKLA